MNENLQRDQSVGGATLRKINTTYKNQHEVDGSLMFWLPDDLDATTLDVWILKLALDAFNVAYATTLWDIPNTGTSVYGSNDLQSFNLEIGHNKTSNIRAHHILGCVADELIVSMKKNVNVEFTINWMGKIAYLNETSYTNGSATLSTAKPLHWEQCQIEYGNDNSTTARNDFTELNFAFHNNSIKNFDIAESSFLVDAFDATTGWSASTDGALAVNTSTFKEGTGSMSVAKSGTTTTACTATKTITARDMSGKVGLLWVYIDDATTLTAIDVGAAGNNNITLGTAGTTDTNVYNMGTGLVVGWNLVRFTVDSPDTTAGAGADETLIDTVRIVFKSDATGDTWAAGKVIVDHLRILTPRALSNIIPQQQLIDGNFTINLTTTSGLEFYDELYGDSTEPLEPTTSPTNKEILARIRNMTNPTTQKIEFRLRNVNFAQIPVDIVAEKVQELTIPFTAQYYLCRITTPDTTAPTNWDDQS